MTLAPRSFTGVLLVGGASRRFGRPKAHATFAGETLAERGWRLLGEACDDRIAVGKGDDLDLPFPVEDDGFDVRVPIAGVVAGLRRSRHDVAVFLPVDCPLMTEDVIVAFAAACRDAAVSRHGPLPGAWARSALPVLERRLAAREFGLVAAYPELDVAFPEVDHSLLVDADTPEELADIETAAGA